MLDVVFVVKMINDEGELKKLYCKDLKLPFQPIVGMAFNQGISTRLWETKKDWIYPKIKEVSFNLDENTFYCLFEDIYDELVSAIWTVHKTPHNSFELTQFS